MINIAFQLYSARHTPLHESLPLIANAGYKFVEAWTDNLKDPELFYSLLQQHGLQVVSLHIERAQLQTNINKTLELAERLDVNHIVCPYLQPAERPTDTAGWSEFAGELAGYTAQIASTGRDFAWHNHDYELLRQADGCMPIRVLLDSVPDMYWEIDIGWIAALGQDPASWLRTYLDRVSAIHVKDFAKSGEYVDEGGWADIGIGTVNWNELVADFKRSDCEYLIAEHDNPADLKRFAESSINTLQSWI